MSAALQPYTTLLKRGKRIPTHLVREAFGGISFYYPDYRAVMNQTKTLEDIMADSTLQWILKEQIGDRLETFHPADDLAALNRRALLNLKAMIHHLTFCMRSRQLHHSNDCVRIYLRLRAREEMCDANCTCTCAP